MDNTMAKRKSTKEQEEFEDTKGVIRIYNRRTDNTMAKRKSTKEQEEFEDTKGVIRKIEEQTTQWPKEKGQKNKKSLKIPKG